MGAGNSSSSLHSCTAKMLLSELQNGSGDFSSIGVLSDCLAPWWHRPENSEVRRYRQLTWGVGLVAHIIEKRRRALEGKSHKFKQKCKYLFKI